MGKFSKIKKYNLDSLSIDEKIKFLDKEMEKTGLCEIANSTSGMYSVQGSEPNPSHNAFKSLSHDGQPLGFSGTDFHIFTEPIGGFQYSPPHPVTGERRRASSWFGIASGFQPVSANSDRQIMWIFDQSLSGGFGRYFSLELTRGSNPFWGTWISTAFGTEMLVPYNSSNSPLSDNIKNNLNNLNINNFLNPDDFGSPTNPVLFQNDLGDPNFLPIDVAKRFIAELLGLAGEGLEYLGTAAADPIGSLTRMGTLGLLQLGSFIQSVVGVKEVNRGMVNAMQQLLGHHNNNNPLHPDFRKHDPTSPNYEGPKPLDLDKKTAQEITKRLDTAISNLNGGNGPTNPNGNLTPDEINQVSDEMNRPYQNGSRDPASVTFYNSLHSLPPNATTFTVKDGKFDYFDTNYLFSDPRDANPLGGKLPDKLGNFVSNVVHGVTTQAVGNYGAGGGEPFYQYSVDDPKYGRGPNNKVIGTQYNTQTSFKRSTIYESYITEGVKLGHFNPEALTVDIEDIRKGIMPEFPEKPPAEMIDGYSAKSKLAPKVIKGEPTIKVTKKDLEALHILKDSEIKELLQQIDLINAHLQKNPADLIYAQQRYPKTDIRLAKLNWKMDQMMNASKEYLDTQFPENQRLVDRIKKATKKTMELTNPEAYKNLNKPDMELMSLDDHMRQKRIVSRHFKKKRQSKSMFRVDMNKVKEKNRKVAEQKVAEWQEKRRIELLNSNEFEDQKYDWRKEIGEDFVNTTQGMKVGQTFTHVPSGQTVTTGGVLGGIETIQTSVELFGDAVPGPTESQYGLQGFAKPIDIMRRGSTKKAEQLNKELDSSEEYTKKVKADKFMKARVEEKYSEQNEMKIVDSLFNSIDQYGNVKDQKVLKKASDYNLELKNNQAELNKRVKEIEEYRVKQTEWEKESERNAKIINSRIQSNISKVKSFVSRYGEKLSDTFPMGSSDIRVAQGGTKLVVISHSGFNYDDSKKFNVRVFDQYVNPETGKKEKIAKIKGNFGITSEADSLFRNPFGKVSGRKGQATIQYVGVGAEIENRMFEIQDIESKPMPKIPPYLMKNQALGWYNAPQSITDSTKNKIITGDFARNVLGAIGSLISSIPGADRQGYEGDIEYAAKLSKDMMDGNLTVDRGPQSKSFNKRLLGLISKNPDRNSVTRSDYAGGVDAIKELPVRLAIQSFEWNATEEGILVNDKFDFDINISGGAISAIPGVQRAIKMVSDAMRMRSVELGFNQVESKYNKTSKKFIYNNMASPEFKSTPSDTMLPVGTQGGQGGKSLGSTTQRGGKEDPYIKAALASNTSVDGFDKDIKILIPWSQVAKDAPALMSKKPTGSSATKTTTPIQSKKTSKVVKGIKKISKSKSIGFDRDDVSFRRKKKRVDR